MCGVAAIYAYHAASPPADVVELRAMSTRLARRGPDGNGSWVGGGGRLVLGHRRLAIIDLDRRAAQPMVSACERYVISFNGEIYNYRELREELLARGCSLRTTSDTEVLLELFARDGTAALARLRGMFAFAIWDEQERVLWLARDPYGIKPLFYADDGWTVRAASQVKALLAGNGVSLDPEPAGIVGFFLYGSVPEPFTCFQQIRAVPAGAIVRIDRLGIHEAETYVAVGTVLREAEHTQRVGDARQEIHAAVLDSVRHHLVADVPVGLFLSSGIDSGALLSLMAEAREGVGRSIRAVTVTFPEYHGRPDDEAPLAAELALQFGAEHTVRVVDEDEFRADLPHILEAMDQPTIDGLNTWFVSKAARELGLKVALSGLGGDELFAGYSTFRDVPHLVRTLGIGSRIPLAGRTLRRLVGPVVQARGWHPKLPGLLELGGTWAGAYLLRRGLFMPWELDTVLEPDVVRAGLHRLRWRHRIATMLQGGPSGPLARVGLLEAGLYMRNQLLRDTDWASMAHSMEIRVPFVDFEVLRRVAPLTLRRPLRGKRMLAESLTSPLPDNLLRRAKTGFFTPVDQWMDRLVGLPAHREPWARRWARIVAQVMLPPNTLRPSDAHPARGPLLAEMV